MAKVSFIVWGSDGLGCGVNESFCEIVTMCDTAGVYPSPSSCCGCAPCMSHYTSS